MNKTTGMILKQQLGLEKFKYVVMARCLETTYRVYLVFIDSRWPTTPLMSGRVFRKPMPSMIFIYPFKTQPSTTPIFNIEDFNGSLNQSLFFVVDISGNFGTPSLRTKFNESTSNENWQRYINQPSEAIKNGEFYWQDSSNDEIHGGKISYLDPKDFIVEVNCKLHNKKCFTANFRDSQNDEWWKEAQKVILINEFRNYIYSQNISNLLEGLTINDLKKNAISNLNKIYLSKRRKEGQSGSYLEEINWDEEKDTITLEWSIVPTYEKSVTNYSPTGDKYTANDYLAEVQFINVNKYLGTKKDYLEFTPKEQGQLVSDMLKNGEVKLWSSDPSFIFQGTMEAMDDLDASIYPLWSPKGKGIWNSRHGKEPHVTKHIAEILSVIFQNYSIIAKLLREN
jgi:hypothetical protein